MLAFSSIGLCVKDMGKMVAFYRDCVGLDLDWDGGCFTGVKLESGIFFNLCERSAMEEGNTKPFTYPSGVNGTMEVCFSVDKPEEVEKEFNRLIEGGATPISEPVDYPYGLRSCFVADPEGNLIEIVASLD